MSAVTVILNRAHNGDPKTAEELLPLVHDELRRVAAARMAAVFPVDAVSASFQGRSI